MNTGFSGKSSDINTNTLDSIKMTKSQNRLKWQLLILPVVTIIFLASWQFLAIKQLLPLPTPLAVTKKFWELVIDGDPLFGKTLQLMAGASLLTVFKGVSLGMVIGLTGGIVLGSVPSLEREVRKIIDLLRPVPPLAWIPLAYILFSKVPQPSDYVQVFIIFVGSVFPIFTSTVQGVLYVDQKHVDVLRTMGANYRQVIRHALFPAALPSILAGMRTGLGVGWMSVIAAEFVSGKTGIGFYIWASYSVGGRTAEIIAGTITIGLVGYSMNLLITKVEERLIRWR